MGYMKSVDIVLTAYKLSDAQKNAVVELLSGGFSTAKPNTIKSLENKGLVINKGDFYLFEESFKAELKAAYSTPESREVKSVAASQGVVLSDEEALQVSQEESLESLLQGDPWKMGDAITEDEAFIVLDGPVLPAKTEYVVSPDTFQSVWLPWEVELMGFGATLEWKGTEVWDGLTAAEIKEDMETATPINRKARRTHFRTLRNAFRRVTVQRPRKALKITGKVGV